MKLFSEYRRYLIGCLVILLGASSITLAESRIQLDTQPQVLKKLNTIHQYLADQQWDAAIKIIEQVQQEHAHQLLKIGQHQILPVQTVCHMLVSQFPKAGLAAYRKQFDVLAERWYKDALTNHNEQRMQSLLHEMYNSSYGDQALLWLGDQAWQQDRLESARAYWTQLLPVQHASENADVPPRVLRYPDSEIPTPQILARLILCRMAEKQFQRAHIELDAFRKRYPDWEGALAGEQGVLAETLANALAKQQLWAQAARNETTTFAGNAARSQIYEQFDVPYVPLWTRSLPKIKWQRIPKPSGPLRQRSLSLLPVTARQKLFFSDGESIYAWKQKSGQPAWPVEQNSQGKIFSTQQNELSTITNLSVLGIPRFTLTVAHDKLFARMGSPVVSRPFRQAELHDSQSRIVCLDIGTGQGKLLWQLEASSFQSGWEFEGTPLFSQGKLFLVMRKSHPQLQWNVICLNATTGEIIWNHKACASLESVNESLPEVSHHLLTLAGDKIIYVTHHGAIIALDTNSGHIQWAATYDHISEPQARTISNTLKPALFINNTIIAAPADSNKVFGIDSASGIILWKRALPGGAAYLIGAKDNRVYLSGQRLWSLDTSSGKILWQVGFQRDTTSVFGQGVITDRYLLWPHREEIFVVASHSGEILQRIRLKQRYNLGGGDLVISGQILFVVQADRLTAFGNTNPTGPQTN